MKPIKLTINAFGSFLKETTIDFNILNQAGFYLITGATGSGKTTIFDAIMFALYNEASGDIREVDGFRNDLALDDNPTYVEFTFEKDNIIYCVTRSPRYSIKTRKTPLEAKAKLIYGNTIVEKTKQVDEKIISILGLSSTQFRQLIMLAQGEFMKLIHAKSNERDEIFRKIFGTEILDKIENLLKEETKTLKLEQSTLEQQINKLIISIPNIDKYRTISLVEKDLNHTNELIDELNELISLNKDTDIHLEEDIKSKDKELIALITSKESARSINQDFEILKTLNEEFTKTKKNESAVNELRNKIKILKQLEPAKVLYDDLQNLTKQINITKSQLEANKMELSSKQEELNVYIDNSNMIELDRASLENLKKTKQEIEQNISLLKEIEELDKVLLEHNTKLTNVENLIINTKKEKENLIITIETLKQEIETLSDCVVNQNIILGNIEKLKDLYKELEILVTLNKQLLAEKTNLANNINDYQVLYAKYQKELELYNHAELTYFNNIAGVLAKELKENEPCPVCGSKEHPSIANLSNEVITKEELDNKFNNLEALRIKKDEKLLTVETFKTKITSIINQLIAALNISDETLIDEALITLRNNYDNLSKQYQEELDKCNKQIEKKKHLEKELSESNDKQTLIDININDLNEQKLTITANLSSVKGNLESLTSKLTFSNTIEELELAKEERNEAILLLEEAINGFDEGLKKVQEEYKLIEGKLQQSNDYLSNIVKTYSQIQNRYNDLIDDMDLDLNVLNNLESHFNDLINLSIYVEKVSIYDVSINNLQKQINEYKEKLKDKTYIDTSTLDEQISKLTKELETLKTSQSNLKTVLIKQIDIYNELKNIYIEYVNKTKEYTDTLDLSLIANGQNQKYLSFERYVLVEYFDNILSHANIRLSKMTNGRYLLYRKVDLAKGRAQQGLDMEIFDFETGKKRDVKTLSGGETFKAALSLALGLADAIENKVGAISIDTLFIDEGFGTLDDESLHQAIEILLELKSDNKSIGIISHVQELKDIISTKLVVTKDEEGSKIKIIA